MCYEAALVNKFLGVVICNASAHESVRKFPDSGKIPIQMLFIVYINDFAKASILFNFIMYADYTTLLCTLESFSTYEQNGNIDVAINFELKQLVNR